MVEKLKNDSDEEDVIKECTKKLRAGVHLQLFLNSGQRILVVELTGETAKLPFKAFIMEMKNKYKTLLKVHVKGKRSVQFD